MIIYEFVAEANKLAGFEDYHSFYDPNIRKYIIYKELGEREPTLEELLEQHKSLWKWVSENNATNKSNWPEWINYLDIKFNYHACFACYIANHQCLDCPFTWAKDYDCESAKSVYRQWFLAVLRKDYNSMKKSALKIANKKLKKGFIYER